MLGSDLGRDAGCSYRRFVVFSVLPQNYQCSTSISWRPHFFSYSSVIYHPIFRRYWNRRKVTDETSSEISARRCIQLEGTTKPLCWAATVDLCCYGCNYAYLNICTWRIINRRKLNLQLNSNFNKVIEFYISLCCKQQLNINNFANNFSAAETQILIKIFNSGLIYLIRTFLFKRGHAVAWLVEALCYKPEGRGIESQWGGFFNWPNPSSRTMALGSTQLLTEMSTRNLPWG
jgi:hypothetical protein